MGEEETTFEVGHGTPPPGRSQRAFVAVLEGARAEAPVPLSAEAPVTVGRSRSCSIRIDDPAVSRLQVTLSCDGDGGVWVEDHGSKNGTYVGQERVAGKRQVPPGHLVTVGPASLAVLVPRDRGPERAPETIARGFVAEDPAMQAVVQMLERAARKDATVLLLGETGVGKEVLARWVHRASPRDRGPFVALNCGSVPETLAESTLFGHERGAFTGATHRNRGVFEQAHGGTLFLDEIGELSPTSQTRLLRVLEERTVTRVGGSTPVAVDIRLIAATHRELPREVEAGRFREDLMYRLDVVRVRIPPLRERPDDVRPLAELFLRELDPAAGLVFAPDALDALEASAFPGNVRQLRNAIQRAVALVSGPVIRREHLGTDLVAASTSAGSLQHRVEASEKETIAAALTACDGNQTRAAKRLGIARRTLIYKMERYGLKPPPKPQ